MSVAVIITDRNTDALCECLRASLPNTDIQQWPHIKHPETVKLAVLWQHPPDALQGMNNLQVVVSMGAGMDHIDADVNIPQQLRRERIVTQVLQQNMAQYVLQHILAFHRQAAAYRHQQQQKIWQVLESDGPMPTVGFLGLGQLGAFVADRCAELGFQTLAWTQSQQHPLHPCVHGDKGLKTVCQTSHFLVVLLPLNQQTLGIINRQTLDWCHPDSVLINVARGGHVIADDLLQALDGGQIMHAVLDVFEPEPLPTEHPFWNHPKITLTPHSSSRSDIQQTADAVVKYYQEL